MSRLLRFVLPALTMIILSFFTATKTQGTPLVITINNPNLTASPGATITFSGTVFNPNTEAFTITSIFIPDSFFDIGNPEIPVNFIVNPVPALAMETGDFMTFTIFTVASPGTYTGTFFLRGMVANGMLEDSNEVQITLIVPSTEVPEPATILLLGTGIGGIGAMVRKKIKV